jgi:hypothetical protein
MLWVAELVRLSGQLVEATSVVLLPSSTLRLTEWFRDVEVRSEGMECGSGFLGRRSGQQSTGDQLI